MKNTEVVQKSRTRKSSQDSGLSSRGRNSTASRNQPSEAKKSQGSEKTISKSSSISNLSQARPRSTSLTRSQSQRLAAGAGPGTGTGTRVMSGGRSSERVVRPRSSTLGTSSKGESVDRTLSNEAAHHD